MSQKYWAIKIEYSRKLCNEFKKLVNGLKICKCWYSYCIFHLFQWMEDVSHSVQRRRALLSWQQKKEPCCAVDRTCQFSLEPSTTTVAIVNSPHRTFTCRKAPTETPGKTPSTTLGLIKKSCWMCYLKCCLNICWTFAKHSFWLGNEQIIYYNSDLNKTVKYL